MGELSVEQFATRLAGDGIAIRWGPFTSRVVSTLPELAEPIRRLYADFPLSEGRLVDFRVRLVPSCTLLSRWCRRVEFRLDGRRSVGPVPRPAALALFEWGLNWCVYGFAHTFLIFHSAVVAKGDRALLLPGLPGAGKSTLTVALVAAGWRLLSDELALIGLDTGQVWPLARPIAVKNEAIQLCRHLLPDAEFGPPVQATAKGLIVHIKPPSTAVHMAARPARPCWLVLPRYRPGAGTRLSPSSRGAAMMAIADHALNYRLLGETGFEALVGLIDRSECYRLEHDSAETAAELLTELAANAGQRAGDGFVSAL